MSKPASAIFEFRQYTLHPGRRDELIALFEREFIEPQEALGMELLGLFRDADRPDRFVWIRGFSDMQARDKALRAFYGGDVWKRYRDAANATMIDSDNVLLLRRNSDAGGVLFEGLQPHSPLLFTAFMDDDRSCIDGLRRLGGRILAAFHSEQSPNTFPALPVRQNERLVAYLIDGIPKDVVAETKPYELVELAPTTRSRIQTKSVVP